MSKRAVIGSLLIITELSTHILWMKTKGEKISNTAFPIIHGLPMSLNIYSLLTFFMVGSYVL